MVIEEVRVGITGGGMACGPVSGYVTAEAKIKADDRIIYAGMQDVEGYMYFYESAESMYNGLINNEFEDVDFEECIGEVEEYYENPDPNSEKDMLIRYLIYVVFTDWDECRAFIERTQGKRIGEFEIPTYSNYDEFDDEIETTESKD